MGLIQIHQKVFGVQSFRIVDKWSHDISPSEEAETWNVNEMPNTMSHTSQCCASIAVVGIGMWGEGYTYTSLGQLILHTKHRSSILDSPGGEGPAVPVQRKEWLWHALGGQRGAIRA